MAGNMVFYGACVELGHQVRALSQCIEDATDVTLETVRRHVDRDEMRDLERRLGYEIGPSKGLHLKDDFHVSYHRSRYMGKRCYYVRHSAIEHIFMASADAEACRRKPDIL